MCIKSTDDHEQLLHDGNKNTAHLRSLMITIATFVILVNFICKIFVLEIFVQQYSLYIKNY